MNSPPASPEPLDHRSATPRWQWLGARTALALLVAALVGLLWLLHRQEAEEHRASLIRDVLWVEQNLHFGLERSAEQLRELATDLHGNDLDPERLDQRLDHLLPTSPGLLQVILLDAHGGVRGAAPGPARAAPAGSDVWVSAADEPAFRLARTTGKPAYGPPHPSTRDQEVEVFVPIYRGGALVGTVVGIYGLRAMLTGIVPWWLAEKHLVTIRDSAGNLLAAKSHVEARGTPELTYQVALDPPGHGLVLHVESYRSETKLLRNVLALTIAGLAAAVLWSIWSLRRHIQRRVEVEHAFRREHAFRKAMEDSLETGMRAVDLDDRIIYVNPAFCRMVGFSEGELLGHGSPQPYWPPDDAERIEAAFRAARAGASSPRTGIELELVRRGGARFDALVYEAPLVDAEGRQTGWMASVLDITERKRARERARQQEDKLAATARLVMMGEMASTIAHELNQPLSAIASYTTGCLNVLATGAASPDELAEALRKAAQQTQRAGRIIRRVHEFVRKNEPTRSRIQLHAVLGEAVGFASAEARKRSVRIVPQLAPAEVELEADPLLLQQVVLNLLRNAMEAMAGTPAAEREILLSTERADGAVTVSVADRGCGLAPDVRAQLFEPFFTTKPEGMGMGLNICRSIIELHRGRVWAEPGPQGGTVFSFSLPLEVA